MFENWGGRKTSLFFKALASYPNLRDLGFLVSVAGGMEQKKWVCFFARNDGLKKDMGFTSQEIWVSAYGRYGFQHTEDMGFSTREIWVSVHGNIYLAEVEGISQGSGRWYVFFLCAGGEIHSLRSV